MTFKAENATEKGHPTQNKLYCYKSFHLLLLMLLLLLLLLFNRQRVSLILTALYEEMQYVCNMPDDLIRSSNRRQAHIS